MTINGIGCPKYSANIYATYTKNVKIVVGCWWTEYLVEDSFAFQVRLSYFLHAHKHTLEANRFRLIKTKCTLSYFTPFVLVPLYTLSFALCTTTCYRIADTISLIHLSSWLKILSDYDQRYVCIVSYYSNNNRCWSGVKRSTPTSDPNWSNNKAQIVYYYTFRL